MSSIPSPFLSDTRELLRRLPDSSGDMARVTLRLTAAVELLEAVLNQANAQFAVGERYATFSRATIEAIFNFKDVG